MTQKRALDAYMDVLYRMCPAAVCAQTAVINHVAWLS